MRSVPHRELMTNYHLVILKKPYLDAILGGRKLIESRLSIVKPCAFEQLSPGDKLFLKQSSGPVCATAKVKTVRNFESLTPRRKIEIKQQYNRYILGSDEYWQSRRDCKFGFLIWLEDVKSIEPGRINKKDWRGGGRCITKR